MLPGFIYQLYYSLKDFFSNLFNRNNSVLTITNENNTEEINELEKEIMLMYTKIDMNELYKDLYNLNSYFNNKTNIIKILQFLEYETQFIYNNKNNLEINLNEIKHNMYTIKLLEKFKYLEKINMKEKELFILKQKSI